MFNLLLIVLADHLVTRLVTVALVAYRMLLFYPGIPVSRVLSLVNWQRGAGWSRVALPPIPSPSALLPSMAPVLTPAGRRICLPPAKVHRRLPVIAHGDTEDKRRDNLWLYKPPRAVVPGTGVPCVILVNPVHAIIKEIVVIHLWGIIDWVARHRHEFRVQRQVDPNAYVG
ncbi:MAG TPA: hypothetical protein VGJ93_13745 [Desulfuromonadaceae bacterium]